MKKISALIFALCLAPFGNNFADELGFDPLNISKNLPEKISPTNINLQRSFLQQSKEINANNNKNNNNNNFDFCNSNNNNLNNLKLQNLDALDVIDITLCNNPKTKELWATTLYQATNVGVAKSAYFPTISASIDGSKSYSKQRQTRNRGENRSGRLNFSWLVYDFGGREAKIDQANYLLQAAIYSQNATVQSLILNSLTAFYNVKAKQALVISTKEAELTAAESFNAAKTKYEVGVTTPADVLQAQTAHSQSVLNHIKAVGDFKIAISNLLNAIGIPLPETSESLNNLISPFDAKNLQQTYTHKQLQTIKQEISTALENRPDLLALKQQIEASKESLKIIKTQFLPSINLSGNYNKQYNKSKTNSSEIYYDSEKEVYVYSSGSNVHYWSNSNSLTLSISIPIFSGFSTYYQQKAAEQQIQQNIAKYQTLKSSISNDIWVAYENLHTAFQSIRTTNDLLTSARKSHEMALGRYKSGVGTLIDVLNAQSALASAKQQKIQAFLDWQTSKAKVAYALGNLDYTILEK